MPGNPIAPKHKTSPGLPSNKDTSLDKLAKQSQETPQLRQIQEGHVFRYTHRTIEEIEETMPGAVEVPNPFVPEIAIISLTAPAAVW